MVCVYVSNKKSFESFVSDNTDVHVICWFINLVVIVVKHLPQKFLVLESVFPLERKSENLISTY